MERIGPDFDLTERQLSSSINKLNVFDVHVSFYVGCFLMWPYIDRICYVIHSPLLGYKYPVHF